VNDKELIIQVLQNVIEDLVDLGSHDEYSFDEPMAKSLAMIGNDLTHKQKFFRANKRINQISRLIDHLKKSTHDFGDHEF
jgi:hypothetical protein